MVEVLSTPQLSEVKGKSAHIQTVGVVGSGQMGHGIAQVMAYVETKQAQRLAGEVC